mgnify:CR=1 FL=1
MAFPKGLTRALHAALKAEGKLDAWLDKYHAHAVQGTLEAWMAEQGLSVSEGAKATVAAPKAAPKRTSFLEAVSQQAASFCSLVNLGAPTWPTIAPDDLPMAQSLLEELEALSKAARGAASTLRPIVERAAQLADLLADLETQKNENDALKARLAEMENALKANGHSDKVTKAKGKLVAVAAE